MACQNTCRICPRLAISTAVAITDGTLVITIPENTYQNGEKVCIVVAQTIPADATITTPVAIQIGDGDALYPLTNRCCAQVTACALRTRTKYSTRVATSPTGGTFRLLGNASCSPNYNLETINGTTPVAATTGGEG